MIETKFAWVIEAPGPSYLAVRELAGRHFYWSADHSNALRFFNEKQADDVLMAVRELKPELFPDAYAHFPRVVEHGWMVRHDDRLVEALAALAEPEGGTNG